MCIVVQTAAHCFNKAELEALTPLTPPTAEKQHRIHHPAMNSSHIFVQLASGKQAEP